MLIHPAQTTLNAQSIKDRILSRNGKPIQIVDFSQLANSSYAEGIDKALMREHVRAEMSKTSGSVIVFVDELQAQFCGDDIDAWQFARNCVQMFGLGAFAVTSLVVVPTIAAVAAIAGSAKATYELSIKLYEASTGELVATASPIIAAVDESPEALFAPDKKWKTEAIKRITKLVTEASKKYGIIVPPPEFELIWELVPSYELRTYAEAEVYCSELSLDGRSEWRLPELNELRSLIKGCPDTEVAGECPITNDTPILFLGAPFIERYCGFFGESCAFEGYSCLFGPTGLLGRDDVLYPSGCEGCEEFKGLPASDGCYWYGSLQGQCSQYWSSTNEGSSFGDKEVKLTVDFGNGQIHGAFHDADLLVRCVREP